MSAKIRESGHGVKVFHCPGCQYAHRVFTQPDTHPDGVVWVWNESVEKPTFRPSLDITLSTKCHSFVTDGNIQFLADCEHALAGQTVEIPDWED